MNSPSMCKEGHKLPERLARICVRIPGAETAQPRFGSGPLPGKLGT